MNRSSRRDSRVGLVELCDTRLDFVLLEIGPLYGVVPDVDIRPERVCVGKDARRLTSVPSKDPASSVLEVIGSVPYSRNSVLFLCPSLSVLVACGTVSCLPTSSPSARPSPSWHRRRRSRRRFLLLAGLRWSRDRRSSSPDEPDYYESMTGARDVRDRNGISSEYQE